MVRDEVEGKSCVVPDDERSRLNGSVHRLGGQINLPTENVSMGLVQVFEGNAAHLAIRNQLGDIDLRCQEYGRR